MGHNGTHATLVPRLGQASSVPLPSVGHIDTPWDMQPACHVLVITFTSSFKQGAGRGAGRIRLVGAPLPHEDGAMLGMTRRVRVDATLNT